MQVDTEFRGGIVHCRSQSLSMFCSVTNLAPQYFWALKRWIKKWRLQNPHRAPLAFSGNSGWDTETGLLNPGPIPRSAQFVDYLMRYTKYREDKRENPLSRLCRALRDRQLGSVELDSVVHNYWLGTGYMWVFVEKTL